jgi:tRNA threonylcarbamoyl adenosine modification protein YeaZ
MTPGALRLLVIDTATTHARLALGAADGTLQAERSWVAGYRHGEELLARLERLLEDEDVALDALGGIVVGTGPGAFTGLRVGLATAKALAYARGIAIVGVPTGEALLTAAGGGSLVLLQPAGPSDRVLTRPGAPPRILAGGDEPELAPGERLVAVDLDGRAPDEAVAAGVAAGEGLADALLQAGAARLAAGDQDDLATLVPEYVTLPRGVRGGAGDAGVAIEGSRHAAGAPP